MKKHYNAKPIRIIFLLLVSALVLNILYIGITGKDLISQDDVASFAKKRGVTEKIDYASRGEIYASDGELIATNVKKYKLIIILSTTRESVGEKKAYVEDIPTTAKKLSEILGMPEAELLEKMNTAKEKKRYQIELGKYGSGLNAETKKKIEDTKLSGLEFEESDSRYYPLGDFSSYVVGYSTYKQENGVKKIVGSMGLEQVYNNQLSGKNGYRVYQTDTGGYMLSNGLIKEKNAENGNDIHLTIDSGLQRNLDYIMANGIKTTKADFAMAALMEVKTGKILAISSYPSFNPNELNITNYNNYFLETTFECGSVFKPFIYAQAMEEGKYSHSATYLSGKFDVVSKSGKVIATIHDWNDGKGWGQITFDNGLARSSNVAICKLLTNGYITKDKLVENLNKLGFFQATKIDGLKSSAGTAAYKKDNSLLTLLTTGFGQTSTTTGMQLLKAYSVFGNEGKTVEPYVVDRIVNRDNKKVVYSGKTIKSKQIYSPKTVNDMKSIMLNVIDEDVGTGEKYKIDGLKMFGKTGTAQISGGKKGYLDVIRMHTFCGLAPYDNPQVELVVAFRSGENYSPMVDIVKQLIPAALKVVNKTATSIDTKGTDYVVDSYTNQSTNFVKSKLESQGIKVEIIGNGTSIVNQYPIKDEKVLKSQKVFLVTDGNEIKLPNLVGWSRKDLTTYCQLVGLKLNTNQNTGVVNGQSISPGQTIKNGDTITVTLG